MLAQEMQKGNVLTSLTGLIFDRDGEPVKIPQMKVWEVKKNRTGSNGKPGLVQVSLHPANGKINRILVNETIGLDGEKIRHYEEMPTGLELWEIPADWEVSKALITV